MNVLMIHGIGQEGSTQQELIDKWTTSLHGVAPGLLKSSAVNMAYYGTTLADWTTGKTKAAVGMGVDDTEVDVGDDEEMKFLASALEEALVQSGGGEAEIDAALEEAGNDAVPMDTFIGRRIVGLVRALEKISPAKGSILLRVVKQGHTYLSAPGAGTAVDASVRPYLQKSPQVLITHSLGTVIAFKLLREMEAQGNSVEIPLLITMGSPLGLDAFKKKLGAPRQKPSFVKRWENFYDPSDLVALGKDLDENTFAAGIENDGTVDNQTSNAHGIIGYLPHKGVVAALKKVL
ncbi:hypothetical protein [Agrobacterium tumefaciens]|uniref:Alpha/beta hydrolase n=1 Tax=Agrobacterium tumefaciens TaxID=358 RepID=A0A2L2LMK1_AGRTU|nr:hypothetical protein [Agrobacterium tumefaciens]AVH45563.1 hypothetical protein At1D1609_55320 [Agrobacterium tumefaciens]NSY99359.1 hypothetical protein [Agrobacterium tumefaciens]